MEQVCKRGNHTASRQSRQNSHFMVEASFTVYECATYNCRTTQFLTPLKFLSLDKQLFHCLTLKAKSYRLWHLLSAGMETLTEALTVARRMVAVEKTEILAIWTRGCGNAGRYSFFSPEMCRRCCCHLLHTRRMIRKASARKIPDTFMQTWRC